MLACRLDVDVQFNYTLTIFSAVVSVGFTFLVLASGYVTEALEDSWIVRLATPYTTALHNTVLACLGRPKRPDAEAGYLPLNTSESDLPQSHSSHRDGDEEITSNSQDHFSDSIPDERTIDPIDNMTSTHSSSGSGSHSTTLPVSSADSFPTTTFAWSDSLNATLSHETHMRVKLQSEKTKNWGPWLKAHYNSMSFPVAIKAAIWGAALGFMHYCGTPASIHAS